MAKRLNRIINSQTRHKMSEAKTGQQKPQLRQAFDGATKKKNLTRDAPILGNNTDIGLIPCNFRLSFRR